MQGVCYLRCSREPSYFIKLHLHYVTGAMFGQQSGVQEYELLMEGSYSNHYEVSYSLSQLYITCINNLAKTLVKRLLLYYRKV